MFHHNTIKSSVVKWDDAFVQWAQTLILIWFTNRPSFPSMFWMCCNLIQLSVQPYTYCKYTLYLYTYSLFVYAESACRLRGDGWSQHECGFGSENYFKPPRWGTNCLYLCQAVMAMKQVITKLASQSTPWAPTTDPPQMFIQQSLNV